MTLSRLAAQEAPHDTNISRRRFIIRTSVLATSSALLTLSPIGRAMARVVGPGENQYVIGQLLLQKCCLAFNGERCDPVTGLYHLGQGYRAYNPRMMRFHAADSLSPFGEGGINPYAYCLGDPINLIDPTGHKAGLGAMIGGILLALFGIVVGIVTLGTATPVAAGMITGGSGITSAGIAGVLGVVSGAASIASGVSTMASLFVSDPMVARNLNIAAQGLGIGAAVIGGVQAAVNASIAATAMGQSTARYIANAIGKTIKDTPHSHTVLAIAAGVGIGTYIGGSIAENDTLMSIGSALFAVGGIGFGFVRYLKNSPGMPADFYTSVHPRAIRLRMPNSKGTTNGWPGKIDIIPPASIRYRNLHGASTRV
ncbi:TPA: RHS repeat-associated core domain-containing protein [Aeromonas hydrophila]